MFLQCSSPILSALLLKIVHFISFIASIRTNFSGRTAPCLLMTHIGKLLATLRTGSSCPKGSVRLTCAERGYGKGSPSLREMRKEDSSSPTGRHHAAVSGLPDHLFRSSPVGGAPGSFCSEWTGVGFRSPASSILDVLRRSRVSRGESSANVSLFSHSGWSEDR